MLNGDTGQKIYKRYERKNTKYSHLYHDIFQCYIFFKMIYSIYWVSNICWILHTDRNNKEDNFPRISVNTFKLEIAKQYISDSL